MPSVSLTAIGNSRAAEPSSGPPMWKRLLAIGHSGFGVRGFGSASDPIEDLHVAVPHGKGQR